MARPYPKEFRDDVVRVARNREDGVTIEQIAADFGVHPMTLWKWLRQADIDDGATPGKTTGESAELRELRRRNRLLEQENEVLRRARRICRSQPAGKRLYPLVKELADDGIPVAVTCRVLKLARQPYYRWLANPVTDAELVEAYRANALFDAHRDDPEFGYRSWSPRPATPGSRWPSAPPGGSARTTAGGVCSEAQTGQERQGRPTGP
jgi:Transposase and inactivated derivatives